MATLREIIGKHLDDFTNLGELTDDEATLIVLEFAREFASRSRPNDRSEKDRQYAVLLTDLEKAVGYCGYYIARVTLEAEITED